MDKRQGQVKSGKRLKLILTGPGRADFKGWSPAAHHGRRITFNMTSKMAILNPQQPSSLVRRSKITMCPGQLPNLVGLAQLESLDE
jgi:hypothetical protein